MGSLRMSRRVIDPHFYVSGTAREVGVNLKQGYNGDLTSREAGSVGGQMVKKMTTVRTAGFTRTARTAVGRTARAEYIVELRG